ncbi:MAG TPA: hypothetical protein DCQ64_33455 [Candidatus Rokubacteria bacterium]|nr:hypothetical protein [Candidatus Rokubacteria bacterium]
MSKDAPPFYDSNSPNWFACPFESSTRKRHFCQKPQALLQHLIQCYTRPGDLVVDPFGGSGSTVDAARCLGRRGIMIEANPATAATAATYFAEGAASGRRAAAEAGHLPPPSQDRRQMSLPG